MPSAKVKYPGLQTAVFEPRMSADEAEARLERWNRAAVALAELGEQR